MARQAHLFSSTCAKTLSSSWSSSSLKSTSIGGGGLTGGRTAAAAIVKVLVGRDFKNRVAEIERENRAEARASTGHAVEQRGGV